MGDTAGPTAVEPEYVVTLDQLLLAFSWAADEAGYDLDETNSAALLILRRVENRRDPRSVAAARRACCLGRAAHARPGDRDHSRRRGCRGSPAATDR